MAHPLGREDLWSIEAVVEALAALRQEKPGIAKVMVKLNEAVSGQGNAMVDLSDLPAPGIEGAPPPHRPTKAGVPTSVFAT